MTMTDVIVKYLAEPRFSNWDEIETCVRVTILKLHIFESILNRWVYISLFDKENDELVKFRFALVEKKKREKEEEKK